jgi:hypothetical protein
MKNLLIKCWPSWTLLPTDFDIHKGYHQVHMMRKYQKCTNAYQ